MTESAEVVVVGMGPGGEELAGQLASAGVDTIGVEGRLVGGECPYWGCVPSKMMVRAAGLLAEAGRIPGMAGSVTVTPDWGPVSRRIREEATDHWDDRVAAERFEAKGGRLVRGWGRLDGPGRVVVGDTVIEASRAVVLATGTAAAVPPIPGLEGTPSWTNREAIEVEDLPASLTVIGGGAIGVELSQVFARFGVAVTILEGAERLLPPEEPEAGDLIAGVLAAEGLEILTGVRISSVAHDGNRFRVHLEGREPVTADRLLVAAGRKADIAALGVGTVGVDETARFLPVDDHLRVAEGVWALGDVTGKGAFTHVSMYQAAIVLDDILGRPVTPADYRALPRVTFTDPEVGSVGLSEQAARDAGLTVRTGSAQIPSSSRGWIHKVGNEGFVKLVEDAERGILVGATSAGPAGGEVLGLLTLAVHAEVPVETLRHMIYAYPTFHRAVEAAVADLG